MPENILITAMFLCCCSGQAGTPCEFKGCMTWGWVQAAAGCCKTSVTVGKSRPEQESLPAFPGCLPFEYNHDKSSAEPLFQNGQLGTSSGWFNFTFELQTYLERYLSVSYSHFSIKWVLQVPPLQSTAISTATFSEHMTVCEEYKIIYVHNIKLPSLTEEISLDSLKPFTLTAGSDMSSVKGSKFFLLIQYSVVHYPDLKGSTNSHSSTVTSKKSRFVFLPSKIVKGIRCHFTWTPFADTYCTSLISEVQIRICYTSLGNFCWH